MRIRAILLMSATILLAPVHAQETAVGENGTAQLTLDELRTLADVFNVIRQNYVDPLPEEDLLSWAMQGMVSQLDENSVLLDADSFRVQNEDVQGHYGGVGIEVELRDERIYVLEVVPETPASQEGVKPGDQILSINSVKVKGRPLDDSFRSLHGEPGSEVSIEFKTGKEKARTLTMERVEVATASVRSELLEQTIGYFHITHFHINTADDLLQEIESITEEVAPTQMTGIVLDLRDNAGGAVSAATKIADGFLDSGLVVSTRGRYEPVLFEYQAQPGQWVADIPVAILINDRSASASEILAGALQDHKRATLVGTKSFGKGTVQSVLKLRNGDALKLTTARYFTPSGRQIHGVGIEPDIQLEQESSPANDGETKDPGLKAALDLIRESS